MPTALGKEIAQSWFFESSSGSGIYETLQYVDDSTSCGCPGWTRRVDARGQRSCKHTRMVEQGVANAHAQSNKTYTPVRDQQRVAPTPRHVEPTPATPPPSRFRAKPKAKQKAKQKEPLLTRSHFRPVGVPADTDLVDDARFKRL